MSHLRIVLLVIEIILLAVFVIPLFVQSLNAGGVAGILISLLLIAVTVFWKSFVQLLGNLWEHVSGKIILSILAVVIAFSVCFAGYLSVRMAMAVKNLPERPCTVVVLGCKVKGDVPSLMLKRRLEAAYAYLETNPEVKCIVSGGQGPGENISEAEAMRTYLMEKGIAEERLLLEDKSGNTEENLAFSRTVLEENGLPYEVLIVTDGFHQYRASLLAEEQGLVSYSVSCNTQDILIPTYWVREWFALAKEIFLT
ncbi:MAG: YdcF family protein [Ruminococcus sp.]|nr:YdcF family protein [Ruminococcus sp.]